MRVWDLALESEPVDPRQYQRAVTNPTDGHDCDPSWGRDVIDSPLGHQPHHPRVPLGFRVDGTGGSSRVPPRVLPRALPLGFFYMASGPPRITGIDHIQLAMPPSGEEAARDFYLGVLGFREVEKPPTLAPRGGCWFVRGSVALHLGVEEPFTPARKAHPGLTVSDLDAAERSLREAGAPIVPDASLPGVRRIYTSDPFGNRIELIEDQKRDDS